MSEQEFSTKEKIKLTAQIAAQIAGGYIAAAGLHQEPKEVVRYSLDVSHLMMGALVHDEAPVPVKLDDLLPGAQPKKRGRPPKQV